VGTTIAYTIVTGYLLRQTRDSFRADMLYRVLEQQLRGMEEVRAEAVRQIKNITPQQSHVWAELRRVLAKAWFEGFRNAFSKIDKRGAEELGKLFKTYDKGFQETWDKEIKVVMAKTRDVKKKDGN